MPDIRDKHEKPIKSLDGKEFDNELDYIKHTHGFVGRQVKNSDLPEDERDERWWAKQKTKLNRAR